MDDLIKKGFQQRVSDLEYISQVVLSTLADIVLDHGETLPGHYARDILSGLGVDLEIEDTAYSDQAMQKLGWPKDPPRPIGD